jgi:hypothetical protein
LILRLSSFILSQFFLPFAAALAWRQGHPNISLEELIRLIDSNNTAPKGWIQEAITYARLTWTTPKRLNDAVKTLVAV